MTGAHDLPPVLDERDVPDELLLTEDRLREAAGDGDAGIFGRYLKLLEGRRDDRCRGAARGAGGMYWPCVRPADPGRRYCFAHRELGEYA